MGWELRLAVEAVENVQLPVHLGLRRTRRRPTGANAHDAPTRAVEVVGNRRQKHRRPLGIRAVIVHHRTAVGDQAGRVGLGESTCDFGDLRGRHARDGFRPFRGVTRHLGLDRSNLLFGRGVVIRRHPHVLEVVGTIQILAHDHVGHGEDHGAVGTGPDRQPRSRFRGGVGQAHVEGVERHAAVHHRPDQPLRGRDVVGVGFELVRTEIHHEIGLVVVPVVIHPAPEAFLADPFRGLADRGVVSDGSRAVGCHEIVHGCRLRCLVAPILVHEQLRRSGLAQFPEFSGDLVERLVPGDPLPLVLAPLADAAHGIEDAVGEIDLVDPGLALGAKLAEGPD